MQVAIRILTNTPVWVFPLLAYLIWQGWQSRRPRTARGDDGVDGPQRHRDVPE
jgi:hypothetical protein